MNKRFVLSVAWKKSQSPETVAYLIYVNGKVDQVILATKPLCFSALRRTKKEQKQYWISAVDLAGSESAKLKFAKFVTTKFKVLL